LYSQTVTLAIGLSGGAILLGACPQHIVCQGAPPVQKPDVKEEDDDDDDDEFSFEFAKPPVAPADINLQFSSRIFPGVEGARPTVEILTASTFSLPVERGWPRDKNSPEDVAASMRDVLADRLPRFAQEFWQLELVGAPPAFRGLRGGWPKVSEGATAAALRWSWLPAPFPPLLTLRLLGSEEGGAVRFELGGLACAGSASACISISCAPLGVSGAPATAESEGEERLDVRLTTQLSGFPVAGRAWGFVGCGGSWWHESVRLPAIRKVLEGFHSMTAENMMLFYVAALQGGPARS